MVPELRRWSAIPVVREPLPGRLRHPAQRGGTRLGPFAAAESTGPHRSGRGAGICGAPRQRMTPDRPRTTVLPLARDERGPAAWRDRAPPARGTSRRPRAMPDNRNEAPRWGASFHRGAWFRSPGYPWRSRRRARAGTGVTNPIPRVTAATPRRMSIRAKPGLLVPVVVVRTSVGGGVSSSGGARTATDAVSLSGGV